MPILQSGGTLRAHLALGAESGLTTARSSTRSVSAASLPLEKEQRRPLTPAPEQGGPGGRRG